MQRTMRGVVVAAIIAAAACGSDSGPVPPPTEESVVGRYTLRSVNGFPLPYFLAGNSQQEAFIVSGTMVVLADKTFIDSLTTRIEYASGAPATQDSASSSGTYTLFASNLALVYTSLDPIGYDTVAVIGPRVYQDEGSLFLIYRK